MSEPLLRKKQIYDRAYSKRDYVKEKAKTYYLQPVNQVRIKEYQNRPEVKAKAITKINCECGGKYQLKHRAEHIKTNKHITFFK